jgi:uncharacterized protein
MADVNDPRVIQLAGGSFIIPTEPDPDDVDVVAFAHSLSQMSRFTGHTICPYSVAQHAVLVSWWVRDFGGSVEEQFIALHHDDSEACLSDIARPVKKEPDFRPVYKRFEEQLEAAIATHYGYTFPFPPIIAQADRIIGLAETRDLMYPGFPYQTWEMLPEDVPYNDPVIGWQHTEAERVYLKTHYELEALR